MNQKCLNNGSLRITPVFQEQKWYYEVTLPLQKYYKTIKLCNGLIKKGRKAATSGLLVKF